MAEGIVFDIEEFTVHDGPGIRATVFFKGCPLECNWCHNPEGLSFQPELLIKRESCIECGKCKNRCGHEECRPFDRCLKICPKGLIRVAGEKISSDRLSGRLLRYRRFLEMNQGGITISGGEPLSQPEFLLELMEGLKPVHLAIETSGHGDTDAFKRAISLSDLVYFDIKHMDPIVHKEYTKAGNKLILENLNVLMQSDRPFVARIPLIPGVNDTDGNLEDTARFLQDARNLVCVELLPFNPLTGAKYSRVSKQFHPRFRIGKPVNANSGIFKKRNIECKVL